jgi:hypothetical protein
MDAEDDRCAEAKHIRLIDEAFRRVDLEPLQAACGDRALIPNGPMPAAIGTCLVYAIYHSPLAFIRTLLDLGADPNMPVEDGFPPLIAALTCTRDGAGVRRRSDVDGIVRLLLTFKADPNPRGINDYTARTWLSPSAMALPWSVCSMPVRIRICARGSTIMRRRSRWRSRSA